MGETTTTMGACGCGDEEAEKHKKLEEGAAAPEESPQMKAFHDKMKEAGLNDAAIKAFEANYTKLVAGAATTMPEAEIKPAENVTKYEELQVDEDPKLLSKAVVVKLNGGLGTGMGLDKAKSLLPVKGDDTFLDFIAKQVVLMKGQYGEESKDLTFMLMNSFSTTDDTREYLTKYEDKVGAAKDLEFVQNKSPKVKASDLSPVSHPNDPSLEWCPPGHGDLYPALVGSGTLDKLLADGKKYMFVSNSDNLGATMDLKLLSYFAASKAPFMMEVAARTEADKKGGHLCTNISTGGLSLREKAQCAKEDEAQFQDITKYKYFNTNNLWVDLEALKAIMDKNDGAMPLALIKNKKTVDPRDSSSTEVFQLETAMGAAIESFEGSLAVEIPRTRFAPVKTCNDLLALRSDAYLVVNERLQLDDKCKGVPPAVDLDSSLYKFVDKLDAMVPHGVPSLVDCKSLTVKGLFEFEAGVVIKGAVTFTNTGDKVEKISAKEYENTEISWPEQV